MKKLLIIALCLSARAAFAQLGTTVLIENTTGPGTISITASNGVVEFSGQMRLNSTGGVPTSVVTDGSGGLTIGGNQVLTDSALDPDTVNARLDNVEANNIKQDIRIAVGDSLSLTPMTDGFSDVFTDTNDVNVGLTTGMVYDAGNNVFDFGESGGTEFFFLDFDDDLATANAINAGSNSATFAVGGGNNSEDIHVAGKVGTGAFDHGTLNVQVDGTAHFNTQDKDYSIALWINVQTDGDVKWLFSNDSATKGCFIRYRNNSGRYLECQFGALGGFYNGNASKEGGAGSASGVTIGEWLHVVATVDADTELKVYINGTNQLTDTTQSGDTGTATDFFKIGAQEGNINHFEGFIDDVRVYARAITPTEVLTIFNDYAGTPNALGSAPASGELISEPQLLDFVSTEISGDLFLSGISLSDLNTNVKLFGSEDAGTNYTQLFLSDKGALDGTFRHYRAAVSNMPGVFSNMTLKATFTNVTGAATGWALQGRE